MRDLKIAVLTVSDSCFRNEKSDQSGETIKNLINQKKILGNAHISHFQVVPDVQGSISSAMMDLCDYDKNDVPDVIITTGGTGLSPRDVTPEATRSIIDREVPGISLAMLNESLKKTPFAMLSRAVSGVRKNTLIVNLPGSVKAVVECLTAIATVIPHAVDIIQDRKNEITEKHVKIQAEKTSKILTGHEQNSCSGHNNQSIEISGQMVDSGEKCSSKVNIDCLAKRNRESTYPLISTAEAFDIVKRIIQVQNVVRVNLDQCLGYVLAEDIHCPDPVPSFRASIKDGYAVNSSDNVGIFEVIQGFIAGDTPCCKIGKNQCVRVNTGAGIPEGTDAVVQVEDTELITASDDNKKEISIKINVRPFPGKDVREIGSDIKKGELIMKKGTKLYDAEIGVLATIGVSVVPVFKKPIIGILSTGDELTEYNSTLKSNYHIRDSNRIMLINLFKRLFIETIDAGMCIDEPNKLLNKMRSTLSKCDILITTGSVSMGDRDIVKDVLIKDLGAQIHFGRVMMKPGKPATFATCHYEDRLKYIFALPGNPVSALVTCQLFVLRALSLMNNISSDPRWIQIKIGQDIKRDKVRPEFHRARIAWQNHGPVAYTTHENQASSCLVSMLLADCLLLIPPESDVKRSLVHNGELVEAIMLN